MSGIETSGIKAFCEGGGGLGAGYPFKQVPASLADGLGKLTTFIPHICHFFTRTKFLENKIYTEKNVNYDNIHRKLPIVCVITAKYTENCQLFALLRQNTQ